MSKREEWQGLQGRNLDHKLTQFDALATCMSKHLLVLRDKSHECSCGTCLSSWRRCWVMFKGTETS
jgi:hypothetical protein